ncbi:hypothetical protein MKW92_040316 [Papaver armeniacum]|nr:hypothetical protein MKW92_040316 [Papaver armeniacum]
MDLTVSTHCVNPVNGIRISPSNLGFQTNLSRNLKLFKVSNDSSNCKTSRLYLLKFGFQSKSRISAATAEPITENIDSVENKVSLNPTYTKTPPNRELRTPHSGYHFDGTTRKFFEGWYFKVSIPERRQSFCFMYSVENPAFRKKMSTLEQIFNGPRFTGVGAQILGPDDKYICQFSEESQHFWGGRHELTLGNTFTAGKASPPPNREVPPQEFDDKVSEGFQVTPLWNQGFICDDGRSSYVNTVKTARWKYSTRPVYGWGDVGSNQKATAGWLAAFPVFEPHWQVCMAGGLSSGWIEWDGELFEFENAPSYSEKNWGGAFPKKWFWVQCNVFQGGEGRSRFDCRRWFKGTIGVHCGGKFYEFVPWNGVFNWEIAPWGYWHMYAENGSYKVELEGTGKDPGTPLQAPTSEAGLAVACRDACFRDLRLQMWEKRYDGSKSKVILDVTSNMAVLETGGGPWYTTWKAKTSSPEIINQALNFPIDVKGSRIKVGTTHPLSRNFRKM